MINQGTISSSYVKDFIDYMLAHGISRDKAYKGLSVAIINKISSGKGKINLNDYITVINNSELDTIATAIDLAKQTSITAHGYLGLAVLCGFNLKSVLNILIRFYRTRSNLIEINMQTDEEWTSLTITPSMDLGAAEKFTILITLAVLHSCKCQLLNDICADDIVTLTIPQPENIEQYGKFFSGVIRFNAAQNCLRFPSSQLHEKIHTANTDIATAMQSELESELATDDQPNLLSAIEEVFNNNTVLPNAAQVSEQLFMSERTMRRQLAKLDLNFQSLLEKYRTKLACKLLSQTNTPIIEITHRLGFTDSSNFSKAFRRRTGFSPRSYRIKNKEAQ